MAAKPRKPRCPVNQAACPTRCFMRTACETRPDQVTQLLDRLDPGIALAVAAVLAGERRPILTHPALPR